jgi:hypothetical protein
MQEQHLPRVGSGWLVLAMLVGVPSCILVGLVLGTGIGWLAGGDPRICGLIGVFGGIVAIPFGAGLLVERFRSPPIGPAPEYGNRIAAYPRAAWGQWARLFAILLLAPAVPATLEWGTWIYLVHYGTGVQGQVDTLGGGGNWRTYFDVTYTFTTRDGLSWTRSQEISKEYQRGLRLGGPVPVLFLESDPGLSRLADEPTYRWFLLRRGTVALLVFFAILVWLRRAFHREAGAA